ncbi:sphingomyelin phosphodiesterase [Elysia marginata]|uniref:Sphingomyelin phosphodiesterase n=1 Tax=Elysia marginata TaxID=1093978 RepID=A0AAV4JFV9_9GAST|nr:sphingomyelin phosphodiesterase [Elysia marginata]
MCFSYLIATVFRCAAYSYSPYPGFRIISVNNNYCNTLNFWLLLNATDPCGGLQWLIQELQAAEDKDEKVHLLLHIPPGSSSCLKAWSWNFYTIISRYENTVVNQFYGHEHRDYFHVFLDDTSFRRPTGVGFAAPSVTPYSSTSPTFRIYTIDGNYKHSSWFLQHDNLMKSSLRRPEYQNREVPPA